MKIRLERVGFDKYAQTAKVGRDGRLLGVGFVRRHSGSVGGAVEEVPDPVRVGTGSGDPRGSGAGVIRV